MILQYSSKIKWGILYPLFFFVLFYLQSKTINTGDAGELVTASYGLGIAHPSGYPVYLLISKFFTLLPFGNIPLKVTLVSSFFATALIILGCEFLENKERFNLSTQLFFVFLLLSSYSFVGQACVAKFYPLNTFLIFIIFFLGYKSLYEYNVKYQFIISFLLGLALGLHHTTFFLIIPLLLVIILHFKNFFKNFLFSLFLFFLGSLNVVYLIIRSWKETLLNMSPSPNLSSLFHTILRKAYGESSSVDVAKSLFSIDLDRWYYAIKNILNLLAKQFQYFSFFFFILGCVFLWKKSKRLFLYFLLVFFSYSILLAYFTFSSKKLSIDSLYISGNQYFIPMLVFYAIISAYGFQFIIKNLPAKINIIKYLILVLPLIYFPQHFFLNLYDKNEVAYYKTIDEFFVKPIKSVVIYSGDNDVFQGWYLKNVEKFRDDLCLISAPTISDKVWETNNGCNYTIYKYAYPEVNDKKETFNLAKLNDYMLKKRVYSSLPISENKILNKHLKSYYTIFDFIVFPKDKKIKDLKKWAIKERDDNKGFIHYEKCFNHFTDDLFTKALCRKYITYLTFLAYDIGNKTKKGAISEVDISFSSLKIPLKIYTNKDNIIYLRQAFYLKKINKLGDFYLYRGF